MNIFVTLVNVLDFMCFLYGDFVGFVSMHGKQITYAFIFIALCFMNLPGRWKYRAHALLLLKEYMP